MDPAVKKAVLRKMTYGLWVIAADAGGDREASTVTWVSQASMTPPLVSVGIKVDSHLHAVVEKAGAFSMHLIAEGQKDAAAAFIKETTFTADTIGGRKYAPGAVTKAPLLEGFPCWFEARVVGKLTKGDHSVFLAEVVDAAMKDASAAPLLLATTGWNYGG
ncbi:MAG TPA: flavin reductase family protein [Planctomycetota bacterium]|nr:flavin reductase family protein [Planctomycetota bacterium]